MKIIHGDALSQLQTIEENSIDTIVTDPPYGYSFMNKDWDRVVVSTDIWKECLRVLKAGAFAFIMCAPRQDVLSRQIVNLQDAGFETGFTSIYWAYASGFPKAANVSKLIQKRGENKQLDGAYCGLQPKPAVEVVLCVMKPLSEKSYVDQALANGHGVTWLDSCRIPFEPWTRNTEYKQDIRGNNWNAGTGNYYHEPQTGHESGRFPANLLVSDNVLNDGKITKSNGHVSKIDNAKREIYGKYNPIVREEHYFNDTGSFSRYFDLDKWFETTFPFMIIPKAPKAEKNKGLDQWLYNKVNDGRKTEIDNPFQRGETPRQNTHATVKPVKLFCYLIAMGSKQGDTILDPFCGSGTSLVAAYMTHRNGIGIEINKEYADIANARLSDSLLQTKLM